MNTHAKRVLGCVSMLAVLAAGSPAGAERNERLTPPGRQLKIAGVVLLSIAGTALMASLAAAGASYYYNTGNRWENGHEDTGPAVGAMAGGMAVAAGVFALISLPLVIAGDHKRLPAQATTVNLGLGGLAGTF